MTTPFRFRPLNPDTEDWADNPVSNALAWSSSRFMPRWCSAPGHWTSRVTSYFWTDCPCCLLWRGLALGAAAGAGTGIVAGFELATWFQ